MAIDDNAVVNLSRLFNEETGRAYLVEKGVPEATVSQLDLLGFSGISNVLSAIKTAKYYEMGENDIMLTVLTDSMELYRSRLHEMHQEYGQYSERDAAADFARYLHGQSTDNMLELRYTDRPTQLRGGVGLFQGAAANVWLANPYTNNGLTIAVFEDRTGTAATFNPDPDNQPRPASLPPAADVDLLADGFEQPSVWKANLALDHELPWWSVVTSAELLLTSLENGIHYEHLNLGAPTAIGQDGRQLFYGNLSTSGFNNRAFNSTSRANRDRDFRDVILATNTSKGEGRNLTLALTKPMDKGDNWYWQAAYSYTEATEDNPLTSSRAISNWNGRSVFNPNEEVASRSNYVVRDRLTAAVRYRTFLFGENKTEVGLFYEGRKGKPYSWTFNNDMNGDGIGGNDLMYIPSGPGDVAFVSAADEQQFWDYMAAHPELNMYRGGVADRNGEFSPWVNQFDLRVSQELPGFFGHNKFELWLDIELMSDAPGSSDVGTDMWRFGVGFCEGYGYRVASNRGRVILQSSGTFGWYTLELEGDAAGRLSPADAASLAQFTSHTRFGESWESAVEVGFGDMLALHAGYERTVAFPSFKIWYWLLSTGIDRGALLVLDMFVDAIEDESPYAAPVVRVLLEGALQYGFYELRKEEVNWPFDTEPPLAYSMFKLGLTTRF